MEKLVSRVRQYFIQGQHVTRHMDGIWNGIWTDQFIETTFMKYGHSSGGIIGITLKSNALKIWALSRYLSCKLQYNMEQMEEGSHKANTVHLFHKEEAKGRIKADAKDRSDLQKKLNSCIDPINTDMHPNDSIVDIVNGKLCSNTANVEKSVELGNDAMTDFEQKLPTGFYNTIKKNITVMQPQSNDNTGTSFDVNAIYSRVIVLLSSGRSVDLKDIFSYELSTLPT